MGSMPTLSRAVLAKKWLNFQLEHGRLVEAENQRQTQAEGAGNWRRRPQPARDQLLTYQTESAQLGGTVGGTPDANNKERLAAVRTGELAVPPKAPLCVARQTCDTCKGHHPEEPRCPNLLCCACVVGSV